MPKATVNSIFREYADRFIIKYKTTDYTNKIIRAIIDCRTEELGGHIQKCDHCGHEIKLYNSCRNRHCPQCQFMKKEKWIIDKKNDILPFQYFHVVFTLPDKLNPIVYRNKALVYKLLFDAVKETLLTVSANEKYFGAKVGFFSILHTWGQKLNLHPHIHCVVPGGGYSSKKDKWISASKDYLVPVEVLNQRFRSIMLTGLKKLFSNEKLYLVNTKYIDKKCFQSLIDALFKINWVVYIKESFKSSDSVIEYLSKYTHRIAISNHRILSVKDGIVSFLYKDYKDENKKKIIQMPVMQFIKHFLLHVVPYRFVRIRYYGLLSNSTKKKEIGKCREYYRIKEKKRTVKTWQEIYKTVTGVDIFECKECKKGKMVVSEIIKSKKSRSGP
jgi:hypothetical protein